MKSSLIILAALSGLCALHAQEAKSTPIVALQASSAATHPYLQDCLYPEWSKLTPAQGVIDTRKALADARLKLQALAESNLSKLSYSSVFGALESLNDDLNRVQGFMAHLSYVADSPELRAAKEELMEELAEFNSAVTSNAAIWNMVKTAHNLPFLKECSPEQQRYAQQVYDSFKDNGADLSPEDQKRQSALQLEITQLRHQFSKNVQDSTQAWSQVIVDEAQLEGMSADWKARAAAAAKEKGHESGYLITLDAPSVGPIMSDCTVEATRKLCWEAQCTVGFGGEHDNAAIIDRVMKLRRDLAHVLGFKNFADMTTTHRMVKSGDNAVKFVDELTQKIKPAFDKENQLMFDFIAKRTGKQAGEVTALNPWDRRFYSKELSKELYAFDPDTLKPYHECTNVVQGMFAIYEKLFQIRFEEVPSIYVDANTPNTEAKAEVWDPSVKVYAVYDAKSNRHLGSFYMDLFARSNKKQGAWLAPISTGYPSKDGTGQTPHLACLVCNFPAPTAEQPSLLNHREVQTVFHESGHLLHAMLSNVQVRSHSGLAVAWDFVELPSQIMEYWTWEPEGIAFYAKHYETGEAIPAELVEKLRSSRHFMPATLNMNQMMLAKLDLTMHTEYARYFEGKDLDAASIELLKDMVTPVTQEGPSIMRGFAHIITGGYGAGYYSYKWAEVLAADAFSRFHKEGVLNPKTGGDFRKAILSQGDSEPADELYRKFMGRDPNPDALLEECGLLESTNTQ